MNKDGNYIGNMQIVMITKDIITPVKESPVLVLKISDVSGSSSVIASTKPISISLNYACFSSLAGDYDVVTTKEGATYTWTETIVEIGLGKYLTKRVGTWDPPLNPEYGFIFTDVCSVINVPLQGLADTYSNEVWSHTPGSVDGVTGIITIEYTIAFAAGNVTYKSVYTPK